MQPSHSLLLRRSSYLVTNGGKSLTEEGGSTAIPSWAITYIRTERNAPGYGCSLHPAPGHVFCLSLGLLEKSTRSFSKGTSPIQVKAVTSDYELSGRVVSDI